MPLIAGPGMAVKERKEIIIYSIGKVIELFQSGELIASKELVDYKAEFETIYKPSG